MVIVQFFEEIDLFKLWSYIYPGDVLEMASHLVVLLGVETK